MNKYGSMVVASIAIINRIILSEDVLKIYFFQDTQDLKEERYSHNWSVIQLRYTLFFPVNCSFIEGCSAYFFLSSKRNVCTQKISSIKCTSQTSNQMCHIQLSFSLTGSYITHVVLLITVMRPWLYAVKLTPTCKGFRNVKNDWT